MRLYQQEFEHNILHTGTPRTYRVVTVHEEEQSSVQKHEEVLFRLQGVLVDVKLAPINT